MDIQFTDEECCLRCQRALLSLNKWYYLDNYGNQQGPFDSFLILYYIYCGYFDDSSVFFLYDRANGCPSNYNTLNNYVNKIVEDVKATASSIFPCSHFMEHFGTADGDVPKLDEVHMLDGVNNFRDSEDVLVSTENMYATSGSPHNSREFSNIVEHSSDGNQDDLRTLSNNSILKKRVVNNLKEADAHLNRVNSRRVSHLLEKRLSRESL